MTECAGLIGLGVEELVARFGAATTRRTVGRELWLIFDSAELRLRLRCADLPDADRFRVRSWTASFATGHPTLAEAARSVGLWPIVAPDEAADGFPHPLVRRPLPCPTRGTVYSFTATIRRGTFTGVSVFDEEPDWL